VRCISVARVDHLQIYKRSYDLLLHVFMATNHFPKQYKYTLGEKLKNMVMGVLSAVYDANQNLNKAPFIETILKRLEGINLFLRVARDLNVFPPKKPIFCKRIFRISL
jgi:hypothetical protein